jgi:hypothetical protein
VAPPGISQERLAVLREGFDATLRDPAFLDDAKKLKLNVVPVTAQQTTDIIAHAYNTRPAIVQRTKQALGR